MSGGSNSLKPGDRVGFLYEKGEGEIIRLVSPERFLVRDENDFERLFSRNELVVIHSKDYKLPDDLVVQVNDDDTLSSQQYTVRKEKKTGSRKPMEIWELDLHIEALTDSHSGMSNAEILDRQLREMRSFYSKARTKQIRRIILIHGVGEGVLKEEVRIFLSKQEGVTFYDADFREYGKGATAADLFYNL